MRIRGYERRHDGKHSGGVRKTLGTSSREQGRKGGELLKQEIKKSIERRLVAGGFWKDIESIKMSQTGVYRLQVLTKEWA